MLLIESSDLFHIVRVSLCASFTLCEVSEKIKIAQSEGYLYICIFGEPFQQLSDLKVYLYQKLCFATDSVQYAMSLTLIWRLLVIIPFLGHIL